MRANILIANKDATSAVELISKLELVQVDLTFVDRAAQAIKNIKRNSYDLIIVGDKLDSGDSVDIAFAIKDGKKNRSIAVVYLGHNKHRAIRVTNILTPYGFITTPGEYEDTVSRLDSYFQAREKRSTGAP